MHSRSSYFPASKRTLSVTAFLAVTLACLLTVVGFPSRLSASQTRYLILSPLDFVGPGPTVERASPTTSSESTCGSSTISRQTSFPTTSTCLIGSATISPQLGTPQTGHLNLILIGEHHQHHSPGIGRQSQRGFPFRIIREIIRRRLVERLCPE